MRALVLGCGRVGLGLVRELGHHGADVAVVDVDHQALAALPADFHGLRLQGSALDHGLLVVAGVDRADAAAVVTGDDVVNAVVALACRRVFGVPVVVARLYDPRRSEVVQRLGVRSLSPVAWGIQRFAELLVPLPVTSAVGLGTGGVEVVEVRVPPLLDARPAGDLELPGEMQVAAITHHGRTTIATSATPLAAGDLVHLVMADSGRAKLESLFCP